MKKEYKENALKEFARKLDGIEDKNEDEDNNVITKQLEKMLERFVNKLDEAKNLRSEIEGYLEDKYEIDRDYVDYISDEYTWCYGFDISHIEKLIEEKSKC